MGKETEETMQMVKGVSLLTLLDFVREVLGPGALEELLGMVSPESREIFSGEIIKSRWYPLRHFEEMEGAIIRKYFKGDITYARKIARFTMDRASGDVYRLAFISISTPEEAIEHLGNLWELYNRPGKVIILSEISPRGTTGALEGAGEISDMYLEHLAGWVENLLVRAGAKEARVNRERKKGKVILKARWEE